MVRMPSPPHSRLAADSPPALSSGRGRRLRLDERLVLEGLCPSAARAQALILAGEVLVAGQVVSKAGTPVDLDVAVALRHEPLPYVSRGGLKLKRALEFFAIDVTGRSAIDVGSSTGGFTDCLLQAGAARVCAIDVGYGQLAWSLRSDPRVTVRERVNARTLDLETLPFPPDLAVCDVSFISQTAILPRLVQAVGPGRRPIITLIKPQFEVEKGQVGQGGVVREKVLHDQAIARCTQAAEALGCQVIGVTSSPLRGPAGNEEYLFYMHSPPAS